MGSVKPSEVAKEQIQVGSQILGEATTQPPAGTRADKTNRCPSPGLVTPPKLEANRTCVSVVGRKSHRAAPAAATPSGKVGLRPQSVEAESSPTQGGVGAGLPLEGLPNLIRNSHLAEDHLL